ncbi:5-methylcytosine-specific restriction enzyme A [Lampropedia hyalina DSM 16112]|jgi:5-methylcytosine-specific restriction protein A|uniref:5-methylcytosine-specific restriction enzyme A n=1 Tax=Lampropedia hyalina DSM 16112 TaxID=1122156 RepID=A0A1M4S6Q5_9BURK|nr:HNH endonuclease [Lampropedia hyalina]SHE27878.1 5-methylcytosine-specific restriction enzyme A [Lampropedia hyalina DSM 16112]
MALIFFNIGWMNKYNGIAGDSIERGGKYNQHSIGHEVCNFTNNKGTLYGYVQPVGESIKIEKLGASKQDDRIDGVTVVWTAGPESGGTVVVGWYREATVYRNLQRIKSPNKLQTENGVTYFRANASAENAVLLPVEQRELIIPRAVKGGIGQSNVWFAESKESRKLVEQVTALIDRKIFEPLPDVDQSKSIQEGNPRLVAHLRRERSAAIVKAKKAATLKATGRLCCEVCDFDFQETYGEIGEGFCEVHHLLPLSKSDGKTRTELKDLAVVCSNCHRVIHRTDPMLSISKMKEQISRSRG